MLYIERFNELGIKLRLTSPNRRPARRSRPVNVQLSTTRVQNSQLVSGFKRSVLVKGKQHKFRGLVKCFKRIAMYRLKSSTSTSQRH